ncbi:hypothetical protein M6C35_001985 [Vibrio metschnikovii]|nr:hypothetical protein [Vibrio metschnikovii]
MSYLTEVQGSIQSLAGLGLIVALFVTLYKINQQEKQIVLQQKSLEEVIDNNRFQQTKNHVEHFRTNVDYIRAGYVEKEAKLTQGKAMSPPSHSQSVAL